MKCEDHGTDGPETAGTGGDGWPEGLRRQLLPTCREMARLSSGRLDSPAPWPVRIGMRVHILFCRLCRRYRRQLRWLRAAARAGGNPNVLGQAARDRVKQSLRRNAAGAGSHQS